MANPRYTHGHHESVLRSHASRTVANSAAYLRDHLSAGIDVLDVGCGPGSITVELATMVAPGRVVGIDSSEAPLAGARALAAQVGAANVEFRLGDAATLDVADACRQWWGRMWADRVTASALAAQAMERGLATMTDLDRIAAGWRAWAEHRDGWFIVPHGEIVARPG